MIKMAVKMKAYLPIMMFIGCILTFTDNKVYAEKSFDFDKEFEVKFETPHFRVYATKPESDYVKEAGNFCENFLRLLNKDFGMITDFDYPINIIIFPDKSSFEKYLREQMNDKDGAYGIYCGDINSILTYPKSGWGTLTHEIVHPMLDRNYPYIRPWEEAVTTFFEKFYGYKDKDGKLVIFWGLQNPWRIKAIGDRLLNIKLKDVLFGKQHSQHLDRLVSVFLYKNGKFPLFLELVRKNNRMGYATFVEAAFRKSCAELENTWYDYLRSIYDNRDKIYQQHQSRIFDSKEEFDSANIPVEKER